MKPRLTAAFGAVGVAAMLVLTGCAGSSEKKVEKGIAAQIKQDVTPSGDKLVSVQPYRVSCNLGQSQVQTTYQCPVIGADWTSARAGIARLTIGVPNVKDVNVTGADFHFGSSEVIRVRSKSSVQPAGSSYPATSFDVPLTFVEKLAYSPRSWVRVYTGERFSDANINTGEETGKAVESLAYFMKSVDEVSGRTPSPAAKGGGLFDRLGIGGDEGSSGGGVEGMHPR
ncbi:MAG: hypothetical protein LBE61_22550 [Burkholderiaceae bacterium]|nr:hypothetical protein [Burkholderiaceae bacterium]